MRLKYCPECASIDMKYLNGTLYRCNKCNYEGESREGAIDEINRMAKSIRARHTSTLDAFRQKAVESAPAPVQPAPNEPLAPKEQFAPIEKPSHPESGARLNQPMQLKERLRAMKGKKSDHFEIL